MLPILFGIGEIIAEIAVPALIGGAIGGAVTAAITALICTYLDRNQVRQFQESGQMDDAIRCIAKSANHVTFESIENGDRYEVEANEVSCEIQVGNEYYNYV
ncbi:MAG: hypothetical protein ACI4JM_08770 [Oscillospiraceae bacterium]